MVEDSFDDKIQYLKQNVVIDPYFEGGKLIKAVSLICLVTQANRKKDPAFTVLDALNIVLEDQPGNKVYEYFKERIPLICEIFLQAPEATFDSYGLKGKEAVVAEIKNLLDDWLPF